ncbi:MAG: NADPH-dependent F420 reductase [Chloroflexota bacterium]
MSIDTELPAIAVVGGTGKEGKGLAYRWSKAGYPVIIGSRSPEKAAATAQELQQLLAAGIPATGASNLEAASMAAVVVLTVPHEAHAEILGSIRPAMHGKLLVDATVPLQAGKPTRVHMPPAGSAAQEARRILGEGSEVAAAFHTISHDHLFKNDPIDCDVLVTGTSSEARAQALRLVTAAGLRGWDAGPLENSSVSEGLTSVLIHINKKYGMRHAGIKITGAEQD